jgi:rare lipoprotein A
MEIMKTNSIFLYRSILLVLLAAFGTAFATEPSASQEGDASYYADSLDGNKTASGELYDKTKMTAAHRDLAFGTKVKVTYLRTGKSVTVTINDRGPHVKGRIIDVSGAAAKALGMVEDGHGEVRLEIIAK